MFMSQMLCKSYDTNFDPVGLKFGMGLSSSNNLPGDADPLITLWEMRLQKLRCSQIWVCTRISLWTILKCRLLNSMPREKAMALHSRTLAWKIPRMEEPGRLQSMRSLRVGHDWATSLSLFTFRHWRRKWQPTPVFLPGESQRQWAPVYGVAQSRTQLKRLSSSNSKLHAQRISGGAQTSIFWKVFLMLRIQGISRTLFK